MIYIFFIFQTSFQENLTQPAAKPSTKAVDCSACTTQPAAQATKAAPAPQDANSSVQINMLSSQVSILSDKVRQLANDVDPIKQKLNEFEEALKKKN